MPMHTPFCGIGLRLLSVFLITAMSACVHGLTKTLPVGQIMFWRSAIPVAGLLVVLPKRR